MLVNTTSLLAHSAVVLFTALSVLPNATAPSAYRLAHGAAVITMLITACLTQGKPGLGYWSARKTNQNIQYLWLAVSWLCYRPLKASLVPYLIYSILHLLSFLASNAFLSRSSQIHAQQRVLFKWLNANSRDAMQFVAMVEVMVIPYAIASNVVADIWHSCQGESALIAMAYADFLCCRYYTCPHTQYAFRLFRQLADRVFDSPWVPHYVNHDIYSVIRSMLIRCGTQLLNPKGANPVPLA